MKNTHILYSALLASLLNIACSGAWSQSTFSFNGTISGGSCKIGTEPVHLLEHTPSEFPSIGKSSQWVNFNITSQGCDADIATVHMSFGGIADSHNANLFAIAAGGASGIGIEMQAQDGRAVTPNGTTLLNWTPVAAGSNYPMRARYTSTLATINTGNADSTVTVTLSYN